MAFNTLTLNMCCLLTDQRYPCRSEIFRRLGPPLIERPRSRPAEHDRRERGQVEKVDLVAGRTELRPGGRHLAKLDRTKAVGQVHGNRRHQQDRRQRHADEGNPGADEDGKSTNELAGNRQPRHRVRPGNSERAKGRGESVRSVHDLRIAVRDKTVTDDQSQRQNGPTSEPRCVTRESHHDLHVVMSSAAEIFRGIFWTRST